MCIFALLVTPACLNGQIKIIIIIIIIINLSFMIVFLVSGLSWK